MGLTGWKPRCQQGCVPYCRLWVRNQSKLICIVGRFQFYKFVGLIPCLYLLSARDTLTPRSLFLVLTNGTLTSQNQQQHSESLSGLGPLWFPLVLHPVWLLLLLHLSGSNQGNFSAPKGSCDKIGPTQIIQGKLPILKCII